MSLVIWFTGLSASGKTTLSTAVCEQLRATGLRVEHLDGDLVRRELTRDLGFSKEDRYENVRRISCAAEILARQGAIVLVSAISPYRESRDRARAGIGVGFIEVYVNAPIEVCEQRDPKGLYKRAHAGLIQHFTGVDDPYEPPSRPDLECLTAVETVDQSVRKVLDYIEARLRLANSAKNSSV
jgi:adenylylsulfate kinase